LILMTSKFSRFSGKLLVAAIPIATLTLTVGTGSAAASPTAVAENVTSVVPAGVKGAQPVSKRPSLPSSAPLLAVSPSGSSSASTGTVSPAALSPAGCIAHIGIAHISTYYERLGILAAKVNADIQCNYAVSNLRLTVDLWKTGFFFDYLQGNSPQPTSETNESYLNNENTHVDCANTTQSTFYGTASASVVENGVTYRANVESAYDNPLDCGT
jgi:hypothetical protein